MKLANLVTSRWDILTPTFLDSQFAFLLEYLNHIMRTSCPTGQPSFQTFQILERCRKVKSPKSRAYTDTWNKSENVSGIKTQLFLSKCPQSIRAQFLTFKHRQLHQKSSIYRITHFLLPVAQMTL